MPLLYTNPLYILDCTYPTPYCHHTPYNGIPLPYCSWLSTLYISCILYIHSIVQYTAVYYQTKLSLQWQPTSYTGMTTHPPMFSPTPDLLFSSIKYEPINKYQIPWHQSAIARLSHNRPPIMLCVIGLNPNDTQAFAYRQQKVLCVIG